ncbi:DUF6626 family protein [Blastomonas sp. RAC04]|uniref:DUF6626 family protein n=1 Tax=Blastomonas sp. RAC04 TaxID=1842535 RepID=UPI003FA4906D
MLLDEVFLFLHNTGRAPNHAIFSTEYLGHSARYYDYLRCSDAQPSLRSLVRAALRLTDISEEAGAGCIADQAATLARRVITAAFRRCL